jgi:hypothetical protein
MPAAGASYRALAAAGLAALIVACAPPDRPPDPPLAPPLPPPTAAPATRASSAPVAADVAAEARAFVADLAAQRWDAAAGRLDEETAKSAPSSALAALWRKLEDAGGPFRAVEGAETIVENEVRVVRVVCRFTRLRKVLRVAFADDDRIRGILVAPFSRDLEDSARTLVDKLANGDFNAAGAGFDTLLRGTLPPDKLRAVWTQLARKKGAFGEITTASLTTADGLWAVLLTCRFASGPVVVKVVYDLRDQITGLSFLPGDSLAPWKPPAYAHPDRFVERDLSVGAAPALPGTLTLPKGKGPFPAAVLVHGSGPSDADATLGPNKIFKDIAYGLASRNVAVIRYAKRTHVVPGGVASIKEEVLDSAQAAVDLAAQNRDIDPKRIFVIGHSQGGHLAPRLAAETPAIAGIVLLAAPSRPLQDSLLEQLSYFLKLDPQNAEKQALVAAARAFKVRIEDPALGPDDAVDLPGGVKEKGSYFLSLRGYRPTEVAAKLAIPILVLQGDRDYQVTGVDFDGWKKALSPRPNASLKRYPSLNHLFIAGSGTPRPGEYESPGHVDEAVIEDIAAFAQRLSP